MACVCHYSQLNPSRIKQTHVFILPTFQQRIFVLLMRKLLQHCACSVEKAAHKGNAKAEAPAALATEQRGRASERSVRRKVERGLSRVLDSRRDIRNRIVDISHGM